MYEKKYSSDYPEGEEFPQMEKLSLEIDFDSPIPEESVQGVCPLVISHTEGEYEGVEVSRIDKNDEGQGPLVVPPQPHISPFAIPPRISPQPGDYNKMKSCIQQASVITLFAIFLAIFLIFYFKDSSSDSVPFGLKGTWEDGYNTTIKITENKWIETYNDGSIVIRNIYSYTHPLLLSNKVGCENIEVRSFTPCTSEGIIIAQNSPNNSWHPLKWNRIHYFHYSIKIWHFCTVYYNKDSRQEAEIPPDHPDLFNIDNPDTGCGGFPMSILG